MRFQGQRHKTAVVSHLVMSVILCPRNLERSPVQTATGKSSEYTSQEK